MGDAADDAMMHEILEAFAEEERNLHRRGLCDCFCPYCNFLIEEDEE